MKPTGAVEGEAASEAMDGTDPAMTFTQSLAPDMTAHKFAPFVLPSHVITNPGSQLKLVEDPRNGMLKAISRQ